MSVSDNGLTRTRYTQIFFRLMPDTILSGLFEHLPCHGNSLLELRAFKFFHNGFENHRDIDVLGAFFHALPALHAQGRKLGVAEGDCATQPCSIHEFFPVGIVSQVQVVVLLETQRDVYPRRAGHAVPADRYRQLSSVRGICSPLFLPAAVPLPSANPGMPHPQP